MSTDRNPGPLRVYVVDDSPLIRTRLQEMLAQCRATLAGQSGSVGTAVREIPEAMPDIVILDMQLADGTGFEVLRALHGKAPGIDFYMFSSFAADAYRHVARRFGARGYFDKNSDFCVLRDVVAQQAAARH